MKIQNTLDNILNHKVKTAALRLLCNGSAGWTGRQLAKQLNISPTTASKCLNELAREGILIVRGAGRAYLYSLNERSYTVKNILIPFFQKEKNIFGAITALIKRSLLKTGVRINSALIFGSIAKKEETSRSDIDLLVVVNALSDKKKVEGSIHRLSEAIAQNFQTVISPYILTENQLKKKYKENSPLINEILKSYILLTGKSPERIIV